VSRFILRERQNFNAEHALSDLTADLLLTHLMMLSG
jgi:hypothetical protein